MTWSRPTLTELVERVNADIESLLEGADTQFRRSLLRILGTVFAGAIHGNYGADADTAVQVIPDTAEEDYAERWPAIWGITRDPGDKTSGYVTVTGKDGSSIPLGTKLQLIDGTEFQTIGIVTLLDSSETADIEIEALEVGTAGNASSGTEITFISTPTGVDPTAVVTSAGLTGGVNEETDAELRDRFLDHIQSPPHGGRSSDYVNWAFGRTNIVEDGFLTGAGRSIPASVTRAWCFPIWDGNGTVGVGFVLDDKEDYANLVIGGGFSYNSIAVNGTFATDTDWKKGDGWTISGGSANCDGSQTAASDLFQELTTLISGLTFTVKYTVSGRTAGTITPKLGGTAGTTQSTNDTFTEEIIAGNSPEYRLEFEADASFDGSLDDVELTVWNKGDGWSIGSGKADCDGSQGAASDLYQESAPDFDGNSVIANGRKYTVIFTVSDRTAGTITPKIGGTAGTARSTNGTFSEEITAGSSPAGRIEFEADSSFVGKIDNVQILDKREGTAVVDTATIWPDVETQNDMKLALDVLRPVCAKLSARPLDLKVVSFTLTVSPNTADMKAAVKASLIDLFRRVGDPGEAIKISAIRAAISETAGLDDYNLSSPSASVSVGAYEVPIVDWDIS